MTSRVQVPQEASAPAPGPVRAVMGRRAAIGGMTAGLAALGLGQAPRATA